MKKFKENLNGLLLCIFEFLIGLILLIHPVGFTVTVIKLIGAVMLVLGVYTVVRYFREEASKAAAGRLLTKGLAELLVGGFCLLRSGWFLAAFPVIAILYGLVTLATGISKVQWTVDMIRLKKPRWWLPAIGAVVSLAAAVIIITNPFTSSTVLWIFAGVSFVMEAVVDLVTLLMGGDPAAN